MKPPAEGASGTPLDVVVGHDGKGLSLKVRSAERLAEVSRVDGNINRGRLLSWQRIVVMTVGHGGSRRAFVLEPATEEAEIAHGPFAVRGRFAIVEKANARAEADRLWRDVDVR